MNIKRKKVQKVLLNVKELTYYRVNNQPIRLLNIPCFEDIEIVKEAVEKFTKCGEPLYSPILFKLL